MVFTECVFFINSVTRRSENKIIIMIHSEVDTPLGTTLEGCGDLQSMQLTDPPARY